MAALEPGSARAARLGSGECVVDLLLESLLPPPLLVVVGAERDVEPLVRLAGELGWARAVIDPRPTEGARERFAPLADYLPLAPRQVLAAAGLELSPRTAVVVATHRYLDDVAYLGELLPAPVGYLAVLGPRQRKERLLGDLAKLGVAGDPARLRGPAGLDLGGRSPEEVALAIVAEIQAVLGGRSGRPYDRSQEPLERAPGAPAPERE